jgi:hypothetical protein
LKIFTREANLPTLLNLITVATVNEAFAGFDSGEGIEVFARKFVKVLFEYVRNTLIGTN